jgi:hypothetical protein
VKRYVHCQACLHKYYTGVFNFITVYFFFLSLNAPYTVNCRHGRGIREIGCNDVNWVDPRVMFGWQTSMLTNMFVTHIHRTLSGYLN